MEKQKILNWLDRLIAIRVLALANESFHVGESDLCLRTCENNNNEIHLYECVQKICDVCGFELNTKARAGSMYQAIGFQYAGYYFFELTEGEADV